MKFKIIISFLLIYVLLLNQVFAQILFSEILPNTDDDINLEYIELYNSGTIEQSLSGFILKDKSEKEFVFGSGNILGSFELKKYFREFTKILLNNSNEELFLYNNSGSLIDSFNYTGTIKSEIINILDFGYGIIETNTGSVETNTGNIDVNSGTLIVESGSLDGDLNNNGTGDINILTGVTLSGVIDENNSGSLDKFNLIFSFQNPSYILEKDQKLDEYICDNIKDICKLNLDLRDSFTGSFIENDYKCKIDFGFNGWLNGEENKCNPSTVIFPKGDFDLQFEIIEKSNSGNIFTGGFLLQNKIDEKIVEIEKVIIEEKIVYVDKIIYKNNDNNKESKDDNEEKEIVKKIIISKPDMIIQSGLDENNNCKKEKCSLNLKYEEKNKGEKCLWLFEGGNFSIGTDKKCNPGYVKYDVGDYEVKLKVYQDGNNENFSESILNFSNRERSDKVIPQSGILSPNKRDKEAANFVNIGIYKVMPNPSGSDSLEYVELINNTDENINLKGCSLDDIIDGGSNRFVFKNDEIIKSGKIKKYYKELTGLNFNNDTDEVNLFCNGALIDSLKWNFGIKSGYYLDHGRLEVKTGNAKVLRVIDGDTIEVQFLGSLRKEKLRFIGVDTPETKHPDKKIEKFGIEAYEFTKENLLGKKVLIEIDENNFRDKYSRLLGYVILNGENFNKKLITNGYGKAYLNYSFKYEIDFKKAENYAKKNGLGLWKKTLILNSFPSEEKEAADVIDDEVEDMVDKELLIEKVIPQSGILPPKKKEKEDAVKYNFYSDEVKIVEEIRPIISLQGKIGKNKVVKGNTLICTDTCSVNFDGSNTEGNNIEKYIWDFGNGEHFEGKNPGYIKYAYFGKYKINLKVLLSNGNEVSSSFYIEYVASNKVVKKKAISKSLLSVEKKEIGDDIKINTGANVLKKETKIEKEEISKIEILLYILIFVFSLNLLVLILKREKLL